MKQEIKISQTDMTVLVFIPDSASTTGQGKTGLVAANLTAGFTRVETDNDVVHTDGTGSLNNLASLTASHNDWGILEVSSSLAPGLYRLDLPDAVFATGAWSAVVYVMVTTGTAAATPMEFVLVPQAPIDGVNVSGMTSGDLTAAMKASVNAEVLDVLSVDTFGEPSGVPGATLTLREKIGWLFMALRNKITVTATKKTFYDDSDAAEWEKDLSDDATTYTESEGNAI